MMAPMPSVTSEKGPSVRLRVASPLAATSAIRPSIDLVRNNAPATMSLSVLRLSVEPSARPRDYTRQCTYRESRSRYDRTRPSGSPEASRSLITATDAAPASITEDARSSVMPPMATTGS